MSFFYNFVPMILYNKVDFMKTTKNDIKKIWLTEDAIFIETHKGEIKNQPFEWFAGLRDASQKERENYRLSVLGIHWEALDMDLSFDGFFHYTKQDDNEIARFFKEFPEISMGKFAKRISISPAMLRHYACGTKKPSVQRKKEIQKAIDSITERLSAFHLTA